MSNVSGIELINLYKSESNEDQKIMYLNLIRELVAENKTFANYANNNGVRV